MSSRRKQRRRHNKKDYAIKKTLRKAMHDCCHPMRLDELRLIREQLFLAASSLLGNDQQQHHHHHALALFRQQAKDRKEEPALSYAEQDQAIYAKICMPWRTRIKLPHVMLAWRLRLKDPGSAPVPGRPPPQLCYHCVCLRLLACVCLHLLNQ